jgi:hypothetical protein
MRQVVEDVGWRGVRIDRGTDATELDLGGQTWAVEEARTGAGSTSHQ